MVDWCPPDSFEDDQIRCQHQTKPSDHSALMDIPVMSRNEEIIYQNPFCARCHNDHNFQAQFGSVQCNVEIKKKHISFLQSLTYYPTKRMWTGSVNDSLVESRGGGTSVQVICYLKTEYPANTGRSCSLDVTKTCPDSSQCPKYKEIVVDKENRLFKNYECALCNGVQADDIECLLTDNLKNSEFLLFKNSFNFLNVSINPGDCPEDSRQKWNLENSICSDVKCEGKNQSCNSFFSILLPKYARSHIGFYCFTDTYRTSNITILPNNDLYVNSSGEIYKYGEYELGQDDLVIVCHAADSWTPTMTRLSRTLIVISLVALLLHMSIFIALPKRRNTPSKSLFSMSISIFIVEFLYVFFFYANANYIFCFTVGVVFYYFLCAAFLWMNVLSIDIFRTFTSKSFKVKPHRRFLHYSLYAWCVPSICVLIAVLLNQLSPREFLITPSFGTHRCWFNNKWGLVTFFTFPAGLIVFINMILFTISVINIYQQHKAGKLASASAQKNSAPVSRPTSIPMLSEKNNSVLSLFRGESDLVFATKIKERMQKQMAAHKELKVRLLLYAKLALIMGLTWIFAFISIHTKSYVFEYLFIIFNGLQGLLIFLAFDCKKKILRELREKWRNVSTVSRKKYSVERSSKTAVANFSFAENENNKIKRLSKSDINCEIATKIENSNDYIENETVM